MTPTSDQQLRLREAVAHHRAARFVEAEAAYRALVFDAPDWAGPRTNLGVLLRQTRRLDEALAELIRARDLAPDHPFPHRNLGLVYADQLAWSDALTANRRAVELDPGDETARLGVGAAALALDLWEEAEDALSLVARQNPGSADAWRLQSLLLGRTGRVAQAVTAAERALELDPDDRETRTNLGRYRLALGDFKGGWALYEARRPAPTRAATIPEWVGQDLAGRSLLLICEQGFGDQIQFARFAPMLRDMGADVTLLCAPPLASLFQVLGVNVVPVEFGASLPPADFWAPLMSLAYRLGTDEATIPAAPYLSAPPDRRERWAGAMPSDGVGVVWHGSRTHANDAQRSMPSPDLLKPLEAIGARLVDLQEPRGDFADTAALIEQLRLVITVDTATAHLAGAMGAPCWVMISKFCADWRWLEHRSDSPWYPSVRLFRQTQAGDWAGVVAEVAAALDSAI
jgi:Flp pilus assembly protein TadD